MAAGKADLADHILTDGQLDAAIERAKREWLRLKKLRSRRRYRKTIAANPAINARKYPPEVRARMSAAQVGRKRSAAAIEAVRAGMAASWARRKAAS